MLLFSPPFISLFPPLYFLILAIRVSIYLFICDFVLFTDSNPSCSSCTASFTPPLNRIPPWPPSSTEPPVTQRVIGELVNPTHDAIPTPQLSSNADSLLCSGIPPPSAQPLFYNSALLQACPGLGNQFYPDLGAQDSIRWTAQTRCSWKPGGMLK